MKTISASKFKEQCLALLDQIDDEGLVVTKGGQPVAQVIPYRQRCSSLIGSMRGEIEVHGDISSTGVKWNADS